MSHHQRGWSPTYSWRREREQKLVVAKKRPRPPAQAPKLATLIGKAYEEAHNMEEALRAAVQHNHFLLETCRHMKRAAESHEASKAKRRSAEAMAEEGDDLLEGHDLVSLRMMIMIFACAVG